MALDTDPAGGFRTKDPGAFWFGSEATPDAIVMDTDGNIDCDGDLSAAGGASIAGGVDVVGVLTASGGQLVLADVASAPDAPDSGVILYSQSGVLKCIDPTETVTQLAPAPAG